MKCAWFFKFFKESIDFVLKFLLIFVDFSILLICLIVRSVYGPLALEHVFLHFNPIAPALSVTSGRYNIFLVVLILLFLVFYIQVAISQSLVFHLLLVILLQ